MKTNKDLKQRLKELLHYCTATGVFTWKIKRRGTRGKGQAAGTLLSTGYIRLRIDYKYHLAHRLAFLYMDGSFPPNKVDHPNHIRDDNRWCNIRHATSLENQQNISLSKRNKSGICGVSFEQGRNKWVAGICINKKSINLGRFKNKSDAIDARKAANIKYGFHENHGS